MWKTALVTSGFRYKFSKTISPCTITGKKLLLGKLSEKPRKEMSIKKLIIAAIFLLLIFFALTYVCMKANERAEQRIDNMSTCQQGQAFAKEDISKEHLSLILGGLAVDEKLAKKLESDYHIRIYRRGCVVPSGWDCYNEAMTIAIRNKYGKNVLEIANGTINEN